MKIGELFIALGFKIEGRDKLDDSMRSMTIAGVKATTLAVAVNAINYAFVRMVDRAREAAIVMKNFQGATGLSADELQRWRAALSIEDVGAEEVDKTIAAIQRATVAIRLGKGNIAPFQLLGISPTADPFEILLKFRDRIKQLRPEVAQYLAGEFGISDTMLQGLKTMNLDGLEKRFRMTDAERNNLLQMNRAWKEFLFLITSVANRVSATLAPAIEVLIRGFSLLLKAIEPFRYVLAALVVLIGLLGAALAVVVGGPLAAWTAAILIIVAALGGLALMLNDFWTAIEGGQSVFKWEAGIKAVNAIADGMQRIVDLYDKIKPIGILWGSSEEVAAFMARQGLHGAGGTWKQENNVRVMVDGAQSPEETARAVGETINREISDAAYQMPVPNF